MHVDRAHGCLLGQLAGDALGSLVKFQSPEEIRRNYTNGVRELAEGGTYDSDAALNAYQFRLDSDSFDCGMTIATGLGGRPNPDSPGQRGHLQGAPGRCVRP